MVSYECDMFEAENTCVDCASNFDGGLGGQIGSTAATSVLPEAVSSHGLEITDRK